MLRKLTSSLSVQTLASTIGGVLLTAPWVIEGPINAEKYIQGFAIRDKTNLHSAALQQCDFILKVHVLASDCITQY